eukprot:Phypoly_transcript_04001.p1 GENE.Phypoly_transcript_04001~~Phypoly_transcript_04001.p1  ORF type:complete len:604 (+),score=58.19 Phypoly_transcript_04001:159-1970(+)
MEAPMEDAPAPAKVTVGAYLESTNIKAKQTKEYIEGFYRNLRNNYLSNMFLFDASRKKEGKVKKIELNIWKGTFSYGRLKRRPKISYQFKDLYQCTKSRKNRHKVTVITNTTPREKHKYYLASMEVRERFCEIMWLGLCGVKSVANYTNFGPPRELRTGEKDLSNESTEDVHIFTGTWNMGNAPPPPNLGDWIPPNMYDIYAIGVQECNYAPRYGFGSCEEDWIATLQSHLGENYVKLSSNSLLSIRLSVFCKKEHLQKIHKIEKSTEATGFGHVIGNKGGVAMCCEFYETSLCFVAAHFAAHQEKIEDRNSNYREIVDGIQIGKKNIDMLNQFHHMFWFGDLNYRIELFREEVLSLLRLGNKGATQKLLDADQLGRERAKHAVFYSWFEGPILFNPTYKYEIGNREYTAEKNRVPSWCDRVLWRSLPGTYRVHQTNYSCTDSLMTSDHSPVFSTFLVKARLPIYARFLRHTLPVSEQCVIMIYELKGTLLYKEADEADPYIDITAPYLESSVRTGVIHKTLNPVWSGALSIKPAVGARSFLEHQHLHLRLTDKQLEREMGQCALSLMKAFDPNTPAPFVCYVTHRGRACGTVSGKIHVLYSN